MSSRTKSGTTDAPRPKGLPPHLQVLCRMLRSGEDNRRCAAALVLSELSPRETPVVEALGEVLTEENRVLTGYALEALERIGSRAALPYLLPLLERDEQTRVRAQRAIGALGEPAIIDVCRELAQAPRERRRPLVTLLVELDGKGALQAVIGALLLDEQDFAEQVVQRYHRRWASLAPDARAERREILLRFLERPAHGRTWPTMLALHLLGALGDPLARRAVLPYTKSKHPPAIRRAALHALRRLHPPKGKEDPAFAELAGFLEEEDFEHVVGPALDAMRALPTPQGSTATLKQLLESPHASVRRFAAERLGDLDDAAAATALLKALRGEDLGLHEQAQDSLRKSPASPPLLVRSLRTAEDPDEAWVLARLVAARAAELGTAQVRTIAEGAEAAVQKGEPRAEALLHALRAADPARHREVLLHHGQKLLKKGKADEAAKILSPLDRGEADVEARYALAVALLKASPKDLSRKVRLGDRALALIRDLVPEPDFPLANRLWADKSLTSEDVFYVGFHFAEGEEDQRELGCALLEKIIKHEPRSKLARMARNKIALARRLSSAQERD